MSVIVKKSKVNGSVSEYVRLNTFCDLVSLISCVELKYEDNTNNYIYINMTQNFMDGSVYDSSQPGDVVYQLGKLDESSLLLFFIYCYLLFSATIVHSSLENNSIGAVKISREGSPRFLHAAHIKSFIVHKDFFILTRGSNSILKMNINLKNFRCDVDNLRRVIIDPVRWLIDSFRTCTPATVGECSGCEITFFKGNFPFVYRKRPIDNLYVDEISKTTINKILLNDNFHMSKHACRIVLNLKNCSEEDICRIFDKIIWNSSLETLDELGLVLPFHSVPSSLSDRIGCLPNGKISTIRYFLVDRE